MGDSFIHTPSIHKNKADFYLFNRFQLKHLKIVLENNLNSIIDQHFEDRNRNCPFLVNNDYEVKKMESTKCIDSSYKRNKMSPNRRLVRNPTFRDNSEGINDQTRRYQSKDSNLAKLTRMRTVEILLDDINLEATLPRPIITDMKNRPIYFQMRKILVNLIQTFTDDSMTKLKVLNHETRCSMRYTSLIKDEQI